MALALVASVLVVVAFVAYAVVISRRVPTAKYSNLVLYASQAKAPDFDLAAPRGGSRVTSAVLGGGPAVVNWFQSTCVACQAELATFASVADSDRTEIHFVGIDLNDPSPGLALKMVRRAKANYPVGVAPGPGSISLATGFGVGNLPATVFVSCTRQNPWRGAREDPESRARRAAVQPGRRPPAQLLSSPEPLSSAELSASPFSRRSVRLFAAVIVALLALGALVGALTRGGGHAPHAAKTGSTDGTTATTLPTDNPLPATLASLMGLTLLHGHLAPRVTLVDQHGKRVSLSAFRNKSVLLTFLDAGCTGICPIESAELRAAERDLGAKSADVEVLVVNLDEAHGSVADMARLARLTGLGGLPTFHALTGSLAALRAVWAAYGVQVQVDEVHGTVLYEPQILFINRSDREMYSATPSGFELASGRYVVPVNQVAAFGRGIARYATSLLPSSA